MTALAYVNGTFGPIDEAKVSVEDRGFQFGDGIYEAIVAYDGRLFLPEAHLARMQRSAAGIGLEFDFAAANLEAIMREGLSRSGLRDALVYVQLTRGVAPRAHVIPRGIRPTVVMTFRPLPTVAAEVRERGLRARTMVDQRWANCYIKAITLLPNVLAKNDALREGFDEAIFVTREGEVRECTSANLFVVRDGRLWLPPRTEAILHGVTQGFVIECAAGIGMDASETVLRVADLRSADEVFMSSTTVEVLGISSIDGVAVADGRVGPVTRQLFGEFRRRSRGSAGVSQARE